MIQVGKAVSRVLEHREICERWNCGVFSREYNTAVSALSGLLWDKDFPWLSTAQVLCLGYPGTKISLELSLLAAEGHVMHYYCKEARHKEEFDFKTYWGVSSSLK